MVHTEVHTMMVTIMVSQCFAVGIAMDPKQLLEVGNFSMVAEPGP